jgi:hypothetical protein
MSTNRYHNALHGLDVGQSMHYFLHGDQAKDGASGQGLGAVCTPQVIPFEKREREKNIFLSLHLSISLSLKSWKRVAG